MDEFEEDVHSTVCINQTHLCIIFASEDNSSMFSGFSDDGNSSELNCTETAECSNLADVGPNWFELAPVLLVYAVTYVVGVVGNALIISTILHFKRQKSTTNIFLMSLSSADLLLVLVCIPVKEAAISNELGTQPSARFVVNTFVVNTFVDNTFVDNTFVENTAVVTSISSATAVTKTHTDTAATVPLKVVGIINTSSGAAVTNTLTDAAVPNTPSGAAAVSVATIEFRVVTAVAEES
ncbi:hypothetical protein HAZT_HAZT009764 [Hyalella azteca]|uniref:G-protein coupled receptors family 1 profile domain-containing protein n=1 Tax=Hyalella azteca TaxID=294128 RepID=A0A6A0GSQ2_HYAAZ|nr:hypothetical protein HAZT_HAZT009764 [Hyalella azteca]